MTSDDIDALARRLPEYRPGAVRVEQARTAVLAGAPGVTQLRPASRRVAYALVAGVALAAAAGVMLILSRSASDDRPGQLARAERRGTVVPLGDARFELGPIALDEVVRVHDGGVRITVPPLAADERFRVMTDDAQIEVRAAQLDVEVRADHVRSVVCSSGSVEVRPEYATAVLLEAGQRWDAPEPVVETDAATVEPSGPAPGRSPRPTMPGTPGADHRVQRAPTAAPSAPAPPTAPGEAEFRAGWAALETGKPEVAAASFAAARQAKGSVLAEDASFWEGIALARAGKAPRAIAALRRFVVAYPSSSRAGEAAAKLGWLLYESGDLDAAQTYFESAVDDVVPKVQQSARSGLTAIERKRGGP